MNLSNQRRMAAEILKCGENRVWIDPNRTEDVADAITREDIRSVISSGFVRKLPEKGQSRGRIRYRALQREKGKRRGHGSRKGAQAARSPKKKRWIRNIRPLRRLLRELRDEGKLDRSSYRKLYLRAKGGMYRSRAHLMQHLRSEGHIEEEG
ncbi:MAG: 50S ribosomal protein L19e [Thermoplasmata archaeon]